MRTAVTRFASTCGKPSPCPSKTGSTSPASAITDASSAVTPTGGPGRAISHQRVLLNACGNGAFLVPMVERLLDSADAHGVSFEDLRPALRAYDLDQRSVDPAKDAVTAVLVGRGADLSTAAVLASAWIHKRDVLLRPPAPGRADYVVGNPPYVRLEDVPSDRYAQYRAKWPTMRGRADLYVGFFEVGLRALRPQGRLAFICADRWMHAQYGSAVRRLVEERHAVDVVLRMHDADAFHDSVDAYPAVTVLRRGPQGPVLVAETGRDFGPERARALVRSADRGPVPKAVGGAVAWLPGWYRDSGSWPSGSPARLAAVADLERRLPALQETGARVGIGVASGADAVFLPSEPPDVEPDRLLPLAMAADTAGTQVAWSGRMLVNCWDDDGLVDLDAHPRLKEYLLRHAGTLRARRVGRDRPGQWWRTIDRVHPSLAARPKLLIPDLRARVQPSYDPGGLYPHHNLLHVTGDAWDLRVLGGILLSDVAGMFVEVYSPRMPAATCA